MEPELWISLLIRSIIKGLFAHVTMGKSESGNFPNYLSYPSLFPRFKFVPDLLSLIRLCLSLHKEMTLAFLAVNLFFYINQAKHFFLVSFH
jgi:hypothetical protein